MMIIPFYIAILSVIGCTINESEIPQKPSANVVKPKKLTPASTKKTVVTPVNKKIPSKIQSSTFDGNYSVTINGTLMAITLLTKGENVSGNFVMNGQQAKINGTIKGLTCTGKITEDDTGKTYNFEADRKGEYLNFAFAVPEQNNQVVKLLMKKEVASKASNATTSLTINKSRNQILIGTWRYTEVISSGSGQFYSSFATDYFVKFNQNGSAQIWTGKSAGGTNGVTIDSAKPGTVQQAEWYTEGKLLYFVDPNTKSKSAISYYAEPNRMMLTKGNSKKVYQKIN